MLWVAAAWAQDENLPQRVSMNWRNAGNLALERGLPGVATGPVPRVWYSTDGNTLYAQLSTGVVVETSDFEVWKTSERKPGAARVDVSVRRMPETGAKTASAGDALYAAGSQVYRSTDGGANWTDLTQHAGSSILGGPVLDLAVSPREPGEVTVTTRDGIWRTLDSGLSWAGMNDGLVNFPGSRILSLPAAARGLRVAADDLAAYEWVPGERKAWREIRDNEFAADLERRAAWTQLFGVSITATAVSGPQMYAGAVDGRIWASSDGGASWQPFKLQEMGAIQRIVVDPSDARIALAAVGARPADLAAPRSGAHILRTINGGGFWDDLTNNLADVAAFGVAFERASGTIYAATANGLFMTTGDLNGLGPATAWRAVEGGETWRNTAVLDVRLSAGGHHLYAIAAGRGVFSALAPHRRDQPRLVNATDLETASVAAPGSLLTLAGRDIRAAQLGSGTQAPVLASTADRSEIQVPFDVQGDSVQIRFPAAGLQFGLPLQPAAPSIFIDRDGSPMLLDAATGAMLDGMTAARPGSRIQVLMSGLGRVKPDWPAGVPAPSDAPPEVVAKVRAWVGGAPVDVVRAVLAPGYVGFYLVEIEIPPIVNYGPSELYLDAGGRESNRVRLVIEP